MISSLELPEAARITEHGWELDLPGVIDPQRKVPHVTLALIAASLLLGAATTWWLVPPFAAIALTTLAPRGGTLIYGFSLALDRLEIQGLAPVGLHRVANPRVTDLGIQLQIEGVQRVLELEGTPEDWAWLVETLGREIARHGSTADVPEQLGQLGQLREVET